MGKDIHRTQKSFKQNWRDLPRKTWKGKLGGFPITKNNSNHKKGQKKMVEASQLEARWQKGLLFWR